MNVPDGGRFENSDSILIIAITPVGVVLVRDR